MKDAEGIGFDMPTGIMPQSGLSDVGAGDGLIHQEKWGGTPADRVAYCGNTTKGPNQKPAGVTRRSVAGKGRGGPFEFC